MSLTLSRQEPAARDYSPQFFARRNELVPILARHWNVVPGDVLWGREIKELIGEGTFGKVWRAHNYVLDRDEAVKILHFTKYEDFAFTSEV
jgi:hypothetical protein